MDALFAAAARLPGTATGDADRPDLPMGLLVPHAGLVYSGIAAAAAWACLRPGPGGLRDSGGAADLGEPPVVVLLGTNHRAAWLDGVGVWDSRCLDDSDRRRGGGRRACRRGRWPSGPRSSIDRDAHRGEHSLEVQLPLLVDAAPGARIVPLAVSAGTGRRAIEAGERLGQLLATRRAAGERVLLAISSDMAHYPSADACARATETLLPAILGVDPAALAVLEGEMRTKGSVASPAACAGSNPRCSASRHCGQWAP